MRFLIVGLGSMGKRRIRNLAALCTGEIVGFDPRADRREEASQRYGVRTVESFEAGMGTAPDAVVISTPPDLHTHYALQAARASTHFFTEASVVDDGMNELERECRGRSIVAAPSCTMRFHPSVKTVRRLVEEGAIGRPLALTHHCGQYLPDWHPWEDYRTFYVSRRPTSACREIVPFELQWLTWVLGEVRTVAAMKDHVSSLDADIDDVYQLLLRFDGGMLGHLLVDVVARAPFRQFKLLGQEGVITWDASARTVRLYGAATKGWEDLPEPEPRVEPGYIAGEDMYSEEMARFVSAIRGEAPFPYTIAEDRRVLGLLYSAELSATQGRLIDVTGRADA